MSTPRTQIEQLEPLMDAAEAGRILGYCARSMQRKALSGELPYVLVSGKIRFRPSKLKQYIESREIAPTAA